MKLMSCSVYNVHYTLKPTSTYSGTLDTLKRQLNQVLRLYLGGAVGGVVYKIKDEFRYCKFNNAYKVNEGHYGSTSLAGSKFWVTGDLGGDFSQGQMDWALVTFDKATTPEQRQALGEILGHVFPVKWKSFQTTEGNIDWTADKDQAHAAINGAKTAEVKLKRFQGMTDDPAVLKNVKYWGTPRNDGFVMMPNELETYREGPKAFEFKGTNGFMLTFDMTSKDVSGNKTSMGY